MKKIITLLLLAFALFTSCSVKTNEEKARELIEPQIKANLINPESYEFSQMQLDSCFSNDGERSVDAILFSLKVAKLYKEYKIYTSEAESAESSMTIYAPSFGYQSAHSKQQYKKYKAEMEKAQHIASAAKENILKLYKDNEEMFKRITADNHDFVGWMAFFNYRAETAGGLKTMGGALFFFDKELSKITYSFTDNDLELLKSVDLNDLHYELEDELKEIFKNWQTATCYK